jgi:hypothetical protein
MESLARVVDVESLGDYRLRLRFSDGLVRELDFAGVLEGKIFEPLKNPTTFSEVSLDETAGTIVWPNGVDLDPDVLHGDYEPANGRSARVLSEYRLRATG